MIATADLCDLNANMITSGELSVLRGSWRWFGKARYMSGPVTTLEARGRNAELRQLLDQQGLGRVLVIDASSDPCALLGDNLAIKASLNGWAGIFINGNVRDCRSLASIDLPVLAVGSWPERSRNEPGGNIDVALAIGGTHFSPGDWLYADEDGVLLSRVQLRTN